MAQMTDAELQGWLNQHGGEVGRKDIEADVDDPSGARDSNGNVRKIKKTDRTEITAKDGATLTLRRMGGSLVSSPDAPQYDVVENTPPKSATATKPTNVYVGTNPTTGKPTQVSEYPDPSQPGGIRREYDDTQVPASAAGTAKKPEEKDEGGVRYMWQPNPGGPDAGGKWVAVGSAPETPAERQAREAAAPTQTTTRENRGGKDYTVITIIPKPGQPGRPEIKVIGMDGKEVPGGLPPEPGKDTPSMVEVNGRPFIRHTVTKPDGSPGEIYHTDQQGNRVNLPSEGEATAGGPAMPEIVVGASAEALRKYHAALAADPTLTPAQREKRFSEAVQVATISANEAQTIQRDRESQRNADYHTASTKLTHLQTGTKDALDFVSKFNGMLPAGSTLGGEAFAALLGLNMIEMQLSGINSLERTGPGSTPKPAVPAITNRDLLDPTKIGEKRAEVQAALEQHQAAAAAPVTPPAPPNAVGAGAVGATAAPGVPARPGTPTAPAAPYSPGPLDNVPPPPMASTAAPPLGQGQDASTPDVTPTYGKPDSAPLFQPGLLTPQIQPPYDPANQPAQPALTGPDPSQVPPGEITMTPPSQEWNALALYAPPPKGPTAPPQPGPAAPQTAAAPPVALLRAKINSTPFWELTPDEVEQARALGFSEDEIRSPGRGVAA